MTAQQLEDVGLSHLIGTNILRAYMHGYFIDVRLYNKAKTLTQPFAYDNYKQKKVSCLMISFNETILKSNLDFICYMELIKERSNDRISLAL